MNKEQQDAAKMEKRKKGTLGFFLVFIPIITVLLIIWLWPTSAAISKPDDPGKNEKPTVEEKMENTDTEAGQPETPPIQPAETTKTGKSNKKENGKKYQWSEKTNLFCKCKIPFELRMILLVLLAGALGSYIHMATSFGYFIGMGEFKLTWYWWYWLRIPIGAVLALIFSMLVQGGVFVIPTEGSEANPASVIGIAGLIGMFSRSAIDKLRDIFDIIFKPPDKEKNGNGNDGDNENADNEKGDNKTDKNGE